MQHLLHLPQTAARFGPTPICHEHKTRLYIPGSATGAARTCENNMRLTGLVSATLTDRTSNVGQ